MAVWVNLAGRTPHKTYLLYIMIVTSLNNPETRYIWIKVPRNASRSYSRLFSPGYIWSDIHLHVPYTQEVLKYPNTPGLAIVRHPVSRFISILKYITNELNGCEHPECMECKLYRIHIPLDTIKNLCDFLNDNFEKNCNIKDISLSKIFKIQDDTFVRSFFHTQSYYCYHPKVKIFHYESLEEFNKWIQEELGYDTTGLGSIGGEEKYVLNHLDFSDTYFIKTIEKLYYDDFKLFGYPLQYLT